MTTPLSAQIVLETIADTSLKAGADLKEVYRIGDLAREFDVSLRTLRFYEDRGLITPVRSGSTRLYSRDDRKRLKIILLAKNVGFSLIDIQEILKIYDGEGTQDDIGIIHMKFAKQLDALKIRKFELDRSIEDLVAAIETLNPKI
ncbi:MAG: MerR family transcriptional regulator [Pseudomonadota bacterium]